MTVLDDFRVPRRSDADIVAVAESARHQVDDEGIDAPDILLLLARAAERLPKLAGLKIETRDQAGMGRARAFAQPSPPRIYATESLISASQHGDIAARAIFAHELGHLHLGHEIKAAKMVAGNKTYGFYPPTESAEHQADLYAAGFLVGHRSISKWKASGMEVIARHCAVPIRLVSLFLNAVAKTKPDLPWSDIRIEEQSLSCSSNDRDRATRFQKRIDAVWERAALAGSMDPTMYRTDKFGFLCKRDSFPKNTVLGWKEEYDEVVSYEAIRNGLN